MSKCDYIAIIWQVQTRKLWIEIGLLWCENDGRWEKASVSRVARSSVLEEFAFDQQIGGFVQSEG